MTDDRVAGLPDAGTIQPGDPGHIETHDRMAELMQFAAERIGIILDPPAPKPAVIGEYGHVDAHNTLLANIEQIAREAGTAVGGPPAPILTNPEGGSVVAFTSGGEGAGGPTIAYGAEIEPNDNGETVTVECDDPLVGGEVAVSNTQPFTDYIVTVYGVNVAGRGESATTDAFQLNYNEATGGTEKIVDNYDGTTEKWKVHTFTTGTADKNFVVDSAPKDFRVLVAAGGGGGGGAGGSGGGGGLIVDYAAKLPANTYPVTVGAGGGGVASGKGGQGGKSSISTFEATGGGGGGSWHSTPGGSGGSGGGGGSNTAGGGTPGGSGIAGQGHNGATSVGNYVGGGGGGAGGAGSGTTAGPPKKDSISGSEVEYCGGNRGSYGKGGNPSGFNGGDIGPGGGGGAGVVIVAYQIGTSTKREIAQAQAEAAAREAGYATGYDVGVTDGMEQRNEEIRAMTEQMMEAVKEALPTKDKK